ncbi:hypothetical protein P6166_15100 [Stenotrophomonas sp. HITSZ_GD]|uniref:hypothetical protein n=1 Tax=Stenotrophomonas sp. HITSZ_GD TaxID=3037248 RepID=UPI00240E1F42|nr:hypothetical protein [Stenotrophomonas sp. HITSZ_GD]MDG2526682.1 hypothetical protein [Stenotrophomonas sp. HITSZ_GD]
MLDDIAEQAVGPQDAAKRKQLHTMGQYAHHGKPAEAGGRRVGRHFSGRAVGDNPQWQHRRKMRNLARLGQTMPKDLIPVSGTAGRLLSYGALGTGSVTAALLGNAGLIGAAETVGEEFSTFRPLSAYSPAARPEPVWPL